jgi:protein FrlC
MGAVGIERISVMNISYQFFSLDYFLESAARIGFRSIDLWTGYPHFLVDEDFEASARDVRKRCDERGLLVSNVTPKVIGWPLNIADSSEKIRKSAIKYIERCVDAAEILGAGSLQLVPGTGLHDQPVDEAWGRARESLRAISEYAAKAGKRLVLEALQIVESNLVGNRTQLKRMLDEVGSPNLGAVVDTTHMEKNGEDLDDYFDCLGDRIERVHLNESDQLPWGEGTSPLDVYLAQLSKRDYGGPITVEICSKQHYLRPHNAMKKAYEYLGLAIGRQKA